MKILHIMPYSPCPPNFGGALRIYNMLDQLAREHEITVLTYGDRNSVAELQKKFGNRLAEIHMVSMPLQEENYKRISQFYSLWTAQSHSFHSFYSVRMQKRIDELLENNHFDVVQTEFSLMGMFDLKTDAKKVLDSHNVEYEIPYRSAQTSTSLVRKLHYYREYEKLRREELNYCSNYDLLLTTSVRDKQIYEQDLPDVPKIVIPNGVDIEYFRPSIQASEPWSMVFTGSMNYMPNNDAMLYFLDNIFPLILERVPLAKIYIVGNKPTKELQDYSSSSVVVTGSVDDVRPYVWKSGVFIVPLRLGSGTRLKILEALAMKKPVVSTTVGCEGIDVVNNHSIQIADDPVEMADKIIELFLNNEMRKRLTENGYQLVRDNYDWDLIGNKLLQTFENIRSSNRKDGMTQTLDYKHYVA